LSVGHRASGVGAQSASLKPDAATASTIGGDTDVQNRRSGGPRRRFSAPPYAGEAFCGNAATIAQSGPLPGQTGHLPIHASPGQPLSRCVDRGSVSLPRWITCSLRWSRTRWSRTTCWYAGAEHSSPKLANCSPNQIQKRGGGASCGARTISQACCIEGVLVRDKPVSGGPATHAQYHDTQPTGRGIRVRVHVPAKEAGGAKLAPTPLVLTADGARRA
jgi:hypothetical protein